MRTNALSQCHAFIALTKKKLELKCERRSKNNLKIKCSYVAISKHYIFRVAKCVVNVKLWFILVDKMCGFDHTLSILILLVLIIPPNVIQKCHWYEVPNRIKSLVWYLFVFFFCHFSHLFDAMMNLTKYLIKRQVTSGKDQFVNEL